MESAVEIRFPIASNKRLARGTAEQLNNIEVSPYGLHWPDLDEDLSFTGVLAGDYGQCARSGTSRCNGKKGANTLRDVNVDKEADGIIGGSHG